MPGKRYTPFRQYVLYAYLLVASLLNLYFLQRFAMDNTDAIDTIQWVLIGIITAAVSYCAYTSFLLLTGQQAQRKRHFLRYNLWFNIIQAVNFNLFGVMLIVNLGLKIMPYLSNTSGTLFGIDLELFEMQVMGKFSSGATAVYFGLNIVPIVNALQLDRALQAIREDEQDKAVAEFLSESR